MQSDDSPRRILSPQEVQAIVDAEATEHADAKRRVEHMDQAVRDRPAIFGAETIAAAIKEDEERALRKTQDAYRAYLRATARRALIRQFEQGEL